MYLLTHQLFFLSDRNHFFLTTRFQSTVRTLTCTIDVLCRSDMSKFNGLRELYLLGGAKSFDDVRLPSSLRVLHFTVHTEMRARDIVQLFTHRPTFLDPSTGEWIPEYNPPQLTLLEKVCVKDNFIGMEAQVIKALPQSLCSLFLVLHLETDVAGTMIIDMKDRFPFMTKLYIDVLNSSATVGIEPKVHTGLIHLPENLENLECSVDVFNPSEAPNCLKRLYVHCKTISDGPFPRELRCFAARNCLYSGNLYFNLSQLPQGLHTLRLSKMHDAMSLAEIPRNLRVLNLDASKHQQHLNMCDLPSTLEKLCFAASATQDLSGLPNSLRILKLYKTHRGPVTHLPSTLEKLTLNMTRVVTIDTLPFDLRALKIKHARAVCCTIPLSSKIKSLEFGKAYDGRLVQVPGLEELRINNSHYPHKLPVLPKTLKVLKIRAIVANIKNLKTNRSKKEMLRKLFTNIPASVTFPYQQKVPRSVWESFRNVPQKLHPRVSTLKVLKRKHVHK